MIVTIKIALRALGKLMAVVPDEYIADVSNAELALGKWLKELEG